jgi:hypothetical protein
MKRFTSRYQQDFDRYLKAQPPSHPLFNEHSFQDVMRPKYLVKDFIHVQYVKSSQSHQAQFMTTPFSIFTDPNPPCHPLSP